MIWWRLKKFLLSQLREMNLIVLKGIWTKGFTTSNVEVELAESQSFIADNALESMIDNPESIVKEISAVEEAQPLEMMESPIRHDEDNVEDDEAQSIEKQPRKSNRRESLAASEFSMGSPSYGSFTTYERIPAKHQVEKKKSSSP
ncbi:hypothetical protein BC332_04664 [Capsicum chinense]|nr:hypothetical protein BC332_04664 [Capsicum chinense]